MTIFLPGIGIGILRFPSRSSSVFHYQTLSRYQAQLPPRLLELLPRMFSRHWLIAYQEPAGIEIALRRMSDRLARPNPLAEGFAELSKKRDLLLSDFRGFLPEVCAYTESLMG